MGIIEGLFRICAIVTAVYLIIKGHPYLGFFCFLGAFDNYAYKVKLCNREDKSEEEK